VSRIFIIIFFLIISATFIISGYFKLVRIESFFKIVQSYQLPFHWLNAPVTIILPWIEILSGALLFSKTWRTAAAWCIAILMGVYFIANSWVVANGFNVQCTCFGFFSSKVGIFHLVINVVIAATVLYFGSRTFPSANKNKSQQQ
jgi:putative oxidoreductase